MLAQLRGAVRSKAALVLIGLLVLSFAVWGLSDVFAGRTGIGLAGAGDRRVLKADVERALDSYLQSEREQGRPSNREDAARAGVLTAIIQGQAGRAAELRYADEAGIRASAEAAARILADAPRFKDALTGDFDSEAYRGYLAQIGESPASFEKSLRDDLTSEYIRDAVGAGVDTPTALARLWVLNQTEKRSIAYVLVPPGTAAEVVEPTDEELSSFYEARQSLFTQPERRRVSIMSVSPVDFIDQVEVPDEDVQTAYEIRLRELSGPETRVLAQLSGADRSAVQEAADQIVAGATPEDAANTVEGVDLTVLRVQESELADDAFASAAFRAPEGDVLIPVPSGSGWA
ncbi:MAG: peptidylprolyl isomerase, partial [Pseudomonadota bacterium]